MLGELHHKLLRTATFESMATTKAECSLYVWGAYPALTKTGTTAVMGEVYRL
jgi:gamma-glutamylcyclotransferase (GGCT)/AIG2-like uncharacterized protein YtfP